MPQIWLMEYDLRPNGIDATFGSFASEIGVDELSVSPVQATVD